MTTLFVNACVRAESRTLRLARAVLARLDGPVEEVVPGHRPPADEAWLQARDRLLARGLTDHPMFCPARQFAAAERIVIAAPYWDLSFPAALKGYFEQINVPGITFRYIPQGTPESLCRARALYYVTTAGGAFVPTEYGFGYVKALAQSFYGIREVRLIQAAGLDLDGADPEAILAQTIAALDL